MMIEISINTEELNDTDKLVDLLAAITLNTITTNKCAAISCLLPIICQQADNLERLRVVKPGEFTGGVSIFQEMINDARSSLCEDPEVKLFFQNIIKVIDIIDGHPKKGCIRIENGEVLGFFGRTL